MPVQRIDTRGLNALQVQVAAVEGDTINSFFDGLERGQRMVERAANIEARKDQLDIMRTRADIANEQVKIQKQRQEAELVEMNRMRGIERAVTAAISGQSIPAGTPVAGPGGTVAMSTQTVTRPGVSAPVTGPKGVSRAIGGAARLKPYLEVYSKKSPVIAAEAAKMSQAVEQAKRTKIRIEGVSEHGFTDGDMTFERLAQIVNLENQGANDAIFASLQSKNGLSFAEARDFMAAAKGAVLNGLVTPMDPDNMPSGYLPPGSPVSPRRLTEDQAVMMRDYLNEPVDIIQQAIDSGRFVSEAQVDAAKILVGEKMPALRHNRRMLEDISDRMRELEEAETPDPQAMEALMKEAIGMGAVPRVEAKSTRMPWLDEIVFWTDGVDPKVIPEAMVRTAVDPNKFPGLLGVPSTEEPASTTPEERPSSTAERNAEVQRLLQPLR